MPAEGDKVGPYRLVRVVGRGGMGVVWEAEDERVIRKVAIKVPHPNADEGIVKRFEREARAAASVQHPNVVTVHDVIVEGPVRAIVLELVPGGSIMERITRQGAIPWRDAARLGA